MNAMSNAEQFKTEDSIDESIGAVARVITAVAEAVMSHTVEKIDAHLAGDGELSSDETPSV